MPQDGYIPTAINQLTQGKVIDERFWTGFKRPKEVTLVRVMPSARCRDGRIKLDSIERKPPYGSYFDLRCRPWVEGKMEL
jgi:hypothetical protein